MNVIFNKAKKKIKVSEYDVIPLDIETSHGNYVRILISKDHLSIVTDSKEISLFTKTHVDKETNISVKIRELKG